MTPRPSAFVLASAAALVCALGSAARASFSADPFLWLEDVHGARATAWVRAENAKTRSVLTADPRFAGFRADDLHIRQAKDRIPYPSAISNGKVYEFRQDEVHARGIWRATTVADFASDAPAWTTVIDLDALAKSEGKNWVWHGIDCDSPSRMRCLVSLSDGGEDANTTREFDLRTGAFVTGGFEIPRGKQQTAWLDDDTLIVGREWTPGDVTASGYAYDARVLKRGAPLTSAVPFFKGQPTDVSAGVSVVRDGDGHTAVFAQRGLSFFESTTEIQTPAGSLADVPFPKKSSIVGLFAGRVILNLNEAWTAGGADFPAGSVVSMDLAALEADPARPLPTAVFTPNAHETYDGASSTRDRLLIDTLDNVRGRVTAYTPVAGGGWSKTALPLPDDSTVGVVAADGYGTDAVVSVTNFLVPTTLWHYDAASGNVAVVKRAPARFDATREVVQQFEATSADGTRVPYFVVHPKDMNYDGTAPTILYAYGGFQVSETPSYSGVLGKLWLSHGGTYVLANIRGGGEFGPQWHDAGLKTHRQRVFDDFAAVGRDLIRRRVTSVRHLGIEGGSNGGLLMGVEMTQHPELWHAVDIQVPLLDMLRFEQIAAGASWVGEYGSVAIPDQRRFLEKISPYANLRLGVAYPEPLVWTTMKDDRVGPQHARKFAAKLSALHDPYLFYEQIEGGHGSGANAKEDADMDALEYTYFAEKLR